MSNDLDDFLTQQEIKALCYMFLRAQECMDSVGIKDTFIKELAVLALEDIMRIYPANYKEKFEKFLNTMVELTEKVAKSTGTENHESMNSDYFLEGL